MKKKPVIAAISIAAFGLTVGFGASSAIADLTTDSNPTEGRTLVAYEVNQRGQTYGSVENSPAPGQEPDLIEAFGDDRKTIGYVQKTDLEKRALPKSPDEVAARAASGEKGTVGDLRVSLYAKDGVTVVGNYTVKGWGTATGDQVPPQKQ